LYLASFAEGETRIDNAASEPEVVALGEVLRRLGVEISGLGTNRIDIRGGALSRPLVPLRIPADRIETGTWVAMAVATGGELTIRGCPIEEIALVVDAYRRMGAKIEVDAEGALHVTGPEKVRPVSVETAPFPGFPTDMQAQILVNMCLADGVSQLRETVFENRFLHVAELRRLGAEISIDGSLATVKGPVKFQGAPVMATDLRASASLVIAALCAEGQTKISRIYHLDRGYQRLDLKLQAMGIRIRRVSE